MEALNWSKCNSPWTSNSFVTIWWILSLDTSTVHCSLLSHSRRRQSTCGILFAVPHISLFGWSQPQLFFSHQYQQLQWAFVLYTHLCNQFHCSWCSSWVRSFFLLLCRSPWSPLLLQRCTFLTRITTRIVWFLECSRFPTISRFFFTNLKIRCISLHFPSLFLVRTTRACIISCFLYWRTIRFCMTSNTISIPSIIIFLCVSAPSSLPSWIWYSIRRYLILRLLFLICHTLRRLFIMESLKISSLCSR